MNKLATMFIGFCMIFWAISNVDNVSAHSTKTLQTNIFQFLFGFASNSINQCNRCKCGLPNRRLDWLDDHNLQPYEFPWLANVQVKGDLLISATLLNDKFVITCASSLIGYSPYDVKVIVGMHNKCYPDLSSTILSVLDIMAHPEFLYEARQNDIALLKLATSVPYNKYVSPICLPKTEHRYTGQVGVIPSWNSKFSINGANEANCWPRKIGLPILRKCKQNVLNAHGCVGIYGSSSLLCKEDNGAGVFVEVDQHYYELIGILSDRQECTNASLTEKYNFPMFTRVGGHLNWILRITKEGCFCNKP